MLNASSANTSSLRNEQLKSKLEQHKPEPDEERDLSPREVYYNNLYQSKVEKIENSKTLEDVRIVNQLRIQKGVVHETTQ